MLLSLVVLMALASLTYFPRPFRPWKPHLKHIHRLWEFWQPIWHRHSNPSRLIVIRYVEILHWNHLQVRKRTRVIHAAYNEVLIFKSKNMHWGLSNKPSQSGLMASFKEASFPFYIHCNVKHVAHIHAEAILRKKCSGAYMNNKLG